jgi:hypothetical protein
MYGESCFDFQQSKVFVCCPERPGWLWYLSIPVFISNRVLFYPVKSGLSWGRQIPEMWSQLIIRRPALPLLHTYNDVHNYATFTFTYKLLNQFIRRFRENISLTVQTVDRIPLFSHIKSCLKRVDDIKPILLRWIQQQLRNLFRTSQWIHSVWVIRTSTLILKSEIITALC